MSQNYYREQWRIQSFTNPDKTYTVSLRNDGGYECSCPAWIFQRKRLGNCKHIRQVQENFNIEEITRTRREGRRPRVQAVHTEEYDIALVENGRINGFLADI